MNKAAERLKEVNKLRTKVTWVAEHAKTILNADDYRLFSVMVLHDIIKDEDEDAAKQYVGFIDMMKGAMLAEELDDELKSIAEAEAKG